MPTTSNSCRTRRFRVSSLHRRDAHATPNTFLPTVGTACPSTAIVSAESAGTSRVTTRSSEPIRARHSTSGRWRIIGARGCDATPGPVRRGEHSTHRSAAVWRSGRSNQPPGHARRSAGPPTDPPGVFHPEHPPPYPRRAHVVPVFVSGVEPRTEDRTGVARPFHELHRRPPGGHPSTEVGGSAPCRQAPGLPASSARRAAEARRGQGGAQRLAQRRRRRP